MSIPDIVMRHITFPGTAGVHQRAGRLDQLQQELALNYEHYHEFLAGELEVAGSGPPDPAQYRDRIEEYGDACNRVLAVLVAESYLRAVATAGGRTFAGGAGLVDERHRLLSAADPKDAARKRRVGDRRMDSWVAPAAPPNLYQQTKPAASSTGAR
jgi:hypothetical protein